MIPLMPCRNPWRLCIHLAFTYSISPSSIVWSDLGPTPSSPPMRVLEVHWAWALNLVCEVALVLQWAMLFETRVQFLKTVVLNYLGLIVNIVEGPIWPLNAYENLHINYEQKSHTGSEKYETNGHWHSMELLIISQIIVFICTTLARIGAGTKVSKLSIYTTLIYDLHKLVKNDFPT